MSTKEGADSTTLIGLISPLKVLLLLWAVQDYVAKYVYGTREKD